MSKARNLAGFAGSISSNNDLNVGIITATSFSGTNVNVSGVVTATSFSGDGSGLTGVGIGTDGSVNTVGVITASAVSANEFIGTGDKLIFSPSITSFSPTDGATGVSALSSPNIVLTYDQIIYAGVGTITLRKDSSTGTIVESYEVGVSTRATISNQTLTIDPTNNFDYAQEYYVVIPQGAIKNSLGGNSGILTTYNFTTEVAPTLSSIDPTDESTNIGITTNITFTFDKDIRAGVGTITLRTTSAVGSIIESYDVTSSGRLTFSTNTLTIDPTSNLDYSTVYYVVIPDGAVGGYTGISTYNFTSVPLALGDPYEGGYLICQASGTRWVVAPSSSEVSRNWYSRDDANTTAQSVSGCTGWFVPTCGQLQNPGYSCRTYWDSYSATFYWSSTEGSATNGWSVYFGSGFTTGRGKTTTYCVRSFRCVSY